MEKVIEILEETYESISEEVEFRKARNLKLKADLKIEEEALNKLIDEAENVRKAIEILMLNK